MQSHTAIFGKEWVGGEACVDAPDGAADVEAVVAGLTGSILVMLE